MRFKLSPSSFPSRQPASRFLGKKILLNLRSFSRKSRRRRFKQHVTRHILIIKRKIICSHQKEIFGRFMYASLPSDILKESATRESWQKYYVNFPTNWVILGCAKGVSPWEGWNLIYGSIRMKNCAAVSHHPLSRESSLQIYFLRFPQFLTHVIFHTCFPQHPLWLIKFSSSFRSEQSGKFMCFKCGLKNSISNHSENFKFSSSSRRTRAKRKKAPQNFYYQLKKIS